MPEVSVIVPVYKAEQVLRRCINSILRQTFPDFELILVDDGSPDQCGEICDEYSGKDTRICVIHQKNRGVSSARNAGLRQATGSYIMFVDSDDYVDKDFIFQLYSNKSDLSICGLQARDQKEKILYVNQYEPQYFEGRNNIPFADLYRNQLLYSPWSKLFRGDIIRENQLQFPVGITWGEDGMFVADYAMFIQSVSVSDYTGYNYIKYDNVDSLSTKIRDNIIDLIMFSREYCINKMAIVAPENYAEIEDCCIEDIKWNCSYFVSMLLNNQAMNIVEKNRTLNRFFQNKYVADIISNADVYFADYEMWQFVFCCHKPCYILAANNCAKYLRVIKQWLYNHIYVELPEPIKDIYRFIRKKVK